MGIFQHPTSNIPSDARVNAARDNFEPKLRLRAAEIPKAPHTSITKHQISRARRKRRDEEGVAVSQGRMGAKAEGEDAADERRTGQK
jgi:hypothetical protein